LIVLPIKDDISSTNMLGLIHGSIGPNQQFHGCRFAHRIDGHSHTAGDGQLVAVEHEGHSHRVLESSTDKHCFIGTSNLAEDDELITA